MTTNKERSIPLGIGPLQVRTFLDQKFDNINITSVSGNKYGSSPIVNRSVHVRTDATEKPHDLEVPVLDRRRERRPPMNFRVDVERRLVGLVDHPLHLVQFPIITSGVAL